jgi:hypothetical protein
MALVLLTNVTQYAGPGALDGLLAEGHHVACRETIAKLVPFGRLGEQEEVAL